MHLTSLTLTDVRQFENRTFKFSPGFNLLVGENGAGKTTLIRALIAAMGGSNQRGPYPKIEDEDIRLNRERAEVTAEVFVPDGNSEIFSYRKELWERGDRSHTRKERPLVLSYASNEATCSSLDVRGAKRIQGVRRSDSRRDEEFLFYGAERGSPEGRPQQFERRFGDSHTVSNFLGKILSTFSPDFHGFYWRFEPYDCALVIPPGESKKRVFDKKTEKMVRSAALRYFQEDWARRRKRPYEWPDQEKVILFPGDTEQRSDMGYLPDPRDIWEEIRLDIPSEYREILHEMPLEVFLSPRIMIRRKIGPLSLSQLSDGEQRLFSLFVDIARELSLQEKSGGSIGDGKAIVLIDEIDVHLHPKWQRRIVPALEDLFPNCQFIATTHSPFVIQAISRKNVLTVDSRKSTTALDGGNSIEDIAEEIQGVQLPQRSRRAELLSEAAQKYFALLERKASGDSPVEDDALVAAEKKYREVSEPFTSNPAVHALLKIQLLERGNS